MSAQEAHQEVKLTSSLEDYLETIYQLILDRKVARVRDIARARDVKPGSVSPALRRLKELGLVEYVQREYVDLTPAGEREARRVYARHQILARFFREVLGLEAGAAEQQACCMEHSLSDEAMDRLTSFFEFLAVCPNRPPGFLEMFHTCTFLHSDEPTCAMDCEHAGEKEKERKSVSISDLQPGQRGTVTQVNAKGAIRQRLLDMGILPDTEVEVERVAPAGEPLWIKLEGSQLALRRTEAEAVRVVRPV